MVTQKPISAKIDTSLLAELDKEVALGWRKRNWHINQAIALWLEVQDLNRKIKCLGDQSSKDHELEMFLRHRVPNAAHWHDR